MGDTQFDCHKPGGKTPIPTLILCWCFLISPKEWAVKSAKRRRFGMSQTVKRHYDFRQTFDKSSGNFVWSKESTKLFCFRSGTTEPRKMCGWHSSQIELGSIEQWWNMMESTPKESFPVQFYVETRKHSSRDQLVPLAHPFSRCWVGTSLSTARAG